MVDAVTGWSIGIMVFIIVIMIIYAVVMFEMYRRKQFIFADYVIPDPPGVSFRPQGSIKALTADEIAHRNKVIENSKNIN